MSFSPQDERSHLPRKLGLLGRTLSHSLSKPMWTELLPEICPGCTYELVETEPAILEETLDECLELGFWGLNVTVPYKEKAARWAGRLEGCAQQTGAVNCLELVPKAPAEGAHFAIGHNTDGPAMLQALARTGIVGHSALVLGAGGAARAAVWALEQLEVRRITVVARKPADELEWFTSRGVNTLPWSLDLREWVGDFVIQATPIGFPSLTQGVLPQVRWESGMVAMDLVYGPEPTPFLSVAASQGATVVDGLEILARQAAESWRIWSDQHVRWERFRTALDW